MYNCQTRKRQRWQKGAEALIRKQISYPEFELSSNSTFDFKWLIIMITVMLFRPCLKAQSRSQSSAQATMTYGQSITRCFWLCIVVSSRCALCSTQQLDVSSSSLSLAAWLPEAWECCDCHLDSPPALADFLQLSSWDGLCGQKHCWSRPGEPVSSTKVVYFSFLHVNIKITAYCCFWIIVFDHSERPLAWNAFQSHYACNPVGHMTGLFPLLVCRLPLQIKRKVS